MNCKKCGSLIPEGNKFCNACGTPIEVVAGVAPGGSVPPVAQAPQVAPAAPVNPAAPGAPVPPAAPTAPAPAPAPGTPVPPAPPTAPGAPVPPTAPTAPGAPTFEAPPAPVAATPQGNATAKPNFLANMKKGNKIILLVVAAVIVVAIVLIVMLNNDKNKVVPIQSTTTSSTSSTNSTTTTSPYTPTAPITTTQPIASSSDLSIYGYTFKVPSGYQGVVENNTVVMASETTGIAMGFNLLTGSVSAASTQLEQVKAQLETQGYTNISYMTSTYANRQFIQCKYTKDNINYIEYMIQFETNVIVDVVVLDKNNNAETVLLTTVFGVVNGITKPASTFAGPSLEDFNVSKQPNVGSVN